MPHTHTLEATRVSPTFTEIAVRESQFLIVEFLSMGGGGVCEGSFNLVFHGALDAH